MSALPPVLAATTPMHALPWYFGLAVFAVWSAAAAGLLLLVRRRVKARAERRLDARRSTATSSRVRDDRSLGSGADIEPW